MKTEQKKSTHLTAVKTKTNSGNQLLPKNSSHLSRTDVLRNTPIYGLLLETRDPENLGRIRVRWEEAGRVKEAWLQRLRGMQCSTNDIALVQYVANRTQPVVTGIIENAHEPSITDTAAVDGGKSSIVLASGAAVQVLSENRTPLIEVVNTADGPQLRLLNLDSIINLPGNLSLNAARIKLHASEGKVEITSADDVVIAGKNLFLN